MANNDESRTLVDAVSNDQAQVLRGLITFLREEADAWDSRLSATQKARIGDEVDGPTEGHIQSYLSSVRGISRLILKFLDSPMGGKTVDMAIQEYKQIMKVIKKMAEMLGPVIMICGMSAMICFYDERIQQSALEQCHLDKSEIDRQVNALKTVLNRISSLLQEADECLEPLLGCLEYPKGSVDKLDDLIRDIEAELEIGHIRLKSTEKILGALNLRMQNYRKKGLLKNGMVFLGFSLITGFFYYIDKIDKKFSALSLFAGALPLCHAYFHLTADLSDMMTEIRNIELRNEGLKVELECFAVRLNGIKNKRCASDPHIDHQRDI